MRKLLISLGLLIATSTQALAYKDDYYLFIDTPDQPYFRIASFSGSIYDFSNKRNCEQVAEIANANWGVPGEYVYFCVSFSEYQDHYRHVEQNERKAR